MLAAALWLRHRLGAVAPLPDATATAPLPDSPRPTLWTLRVAALAAGALASVSLTIPAGQTTAIVGPSGSGKSTLANVLLGLITPAQGHRLTTVRLADSIHVLEGGRLVESGDWHGLLNGSAGRFRAICEAQGLPV
jgi:ABC-type bacteriocin/lantibiotic exporter with double-glycine peptidase domain